MRMPNGEQIDVPVESKLPNEIVQPLAPSLGLIARKSAALYRHVQPLALNYYHYENGRHPITFAPDYHAGAQDDSGILRFIIGEDSVFAHDYLLIARDDDGKLSIARDYKTQPSESHHVEVLTSPVQLGDSHEYGEFAVSLFRRIWKGWPQGNSIPEHDLSLRKVIEHAHGVYKSIAAAEELVYQNISSLTRQ